MTAHLEWAAGGQAQVTAFDGKAITLRSTVPSPPGSRIEGALAGAGEGAPARLRVKIHACRREADGAFVLEGRPLDMTRQVREQVEALVAAR